jgi:PAS domain-containing protein
MSDVGLPGDCDFLSVGGEIGARMRAFDWAATPLGSPEGWPQNLKDAIASHVSAEMGNAPGRRDERRRAEAPPADDALRETERRHRDLFESIIEAYCVIEMIFGEDGRAIDFRYLETNPAFVRHATQPMLGKRIKEIVPDFEQFWLDQYGRVALTGEPVESEHMVAGLGGQWFHTSAFRIGGEDSRRVGVVFENITERKRSEEALRESEARLRAVIEEAPLAIALTGPSGRNPAAQPQVRPALGPAGTRHDGPHLQRSLRGLPSRRPSDRI